MSISPIALLAAGPVFASLALAASGRIGWSDAVIALGATAVAAAGALWLDQRKADDTDETGSAPAIDAGVTRFADILTEPCMVINDRATLVYANTAAMAQFPRAKIGDPLAFTLRDPDLVEAIDRAVETGKPSRTELHLTVPNTTGYLASVGPYAIEGEGQTSLVITLYDLTEQKHADRMRSDFIANASHELRTPLTSLMGFIDTLQGPASKDEAARTRFLGIMRGQSERMSSLIDDLLSLSRIELRQHVKPTTEVDLSVLLREVAETLEPRAEKEEVTIALTVPDTPVIVRGDRQELFEVVENLADNAIKYGGDGGRVDISLVPGASRAGDRHAITVADFGAGIAEEHVPRLTERFYRIDAESSRKKKGTGLGLAIVKHIVARHHGEMTIRSKVGEGTRVEILLPR